jgi:hypothetical protein
MGEFKDLRTSLFWMVIAVEPVLQDTLSFPASRVKQSVLELLDTIGLTIRIQVVGFGLVGPRLSSQ